MSTLAFMNMFQLSLMKNIALWSISASILCCQVCFVFYAFDCLIKIKKDFRFRANPSDNNAIQKENAENFADNSQRNSNIQGKLSKSMILNNNAPPKNFKEFLDKVSCECKRNLSFKFIKLIDKIEEIDRFYILYIKALRSSYENIVNSFKVILPKCMNEKNKKDLSTLGVTSYLLSKSLKIISS